MAVIGSASQILQAQDRKYEDVPVPEWGGEVRIISLTGVGRDDFEASVVEDRGKDVKVNTRNLRAKLVAATATDESFNLLFTPDQVSALGEKNGAILDRLFTVAQRLAGMSKSDVEQMVGNSDAAPSGDSTSA